MYKNAGVEYTTLKKAGRKARKKSHAIHDTDMYKNAGVEYTTLKKAGRKPR
jgi:hypothetical protein